MSPQINPFLWPQPGGLGSGSKSSIIKSVQSISKTVAADSVDETTTITSVQTDRAFVMMMEPYLRGAGNGATFSCILTNATTATWKKGNNNQALTLAAMVVELYEKPKSLQQVSKGINLAASGNYDLTISAVSVNAVVFPNTIGPINVTTTGYLAILGLTSTTNLRWYLSANLGAYGTQDFYATVVDF